MGGFQAAPRVQRLPIGLEASGWRPFRVREAQGGPQPRPPSQEALAGVFSEPRGLQEVPSLKPGGPAWGLLSPQRQHEKTRAPKEGTGLVEYSSVCFNLSFGGVAVSMWRTSGGITNCLSSHTALDSHFEGRWVFSVVRIRFTGRVSGHMFQSSVFRIGSRHVFRDVVLEFVFPDSRPARFSARLFRDLFPG